MAASDGLPGMVDGRFTRHRTIMGATILDQNDGGVSGVEADRHLTLIAGNDGALTWNPRKWIEECHCRCYSNQWQATEED